MKQYVRTLTIAGSDSGGCAGIQADLKTFSAFDCFGMSAIVALTAQNTLGVTAVQPVAPEFIAQQIDAVLSDIGVDAIKIGMLHDKQTILTVCEKLPQDVPIVVDPVMVATSGCRLLARDAIEVLKEALVPKATLMTPNLREAEALLGYSIRCEKEMEQAAQDLLKFGCKAVLIKGGHLDHNRGHDCCANEEGIKWYTAPTISTQNTHGSGCAFSAAIAALLAKKRAVTLAIEEAKKYVTTALREGADYRLGEGAGPLKL